METSFQVLHDVAQWGAYLFGIYKVFQVWAKTIEQRVRYEERVDILVKRIDKLESK